MRREDACGQSTEQAKGSGWAAVVQRYVTDHRYATAAGSICRLTTDPPPPSTPPPILPREGLLPNDGPPKGGMDTTADQTLFGPYSAQFTARQVLAVVCQRLLDTR